MSQKRQTQQFSTNYPNERYIDAEGQDPGFPMAFHQGSNMSAPWPPMAQQNSQASSYARQWQEQEQRTEASHRGGSASHRFLGSDPQPLHHEPNLHSVWPLTVEPQQPAPSAHPHHFQAHANSLRSVNPLGSSHITSYERPAPAIDQASDLSQRPGFQDTYANDCPIYFLCDVRPEACQSPKGPRWMIGWPIAIAPVRNVWRLLSLDESMTKAIATTHVFSTHAKEEQVWEAKEVGWLTFEKRRILEDIALQTNPGDVLPTLRNGEWLSVQWVEKVLVEAALDKGLLSRVQVKGEVTCAKLCYT